MKKLALLFALFLLAGCERWDGIPLTEATSGGLQSTQLPVADACWFADPAYTGHPNKLHLEYVGNVLYSAIAIPGRDADPPDCEGTITLLKPTSWPPGADVNLPRK